MQDPAYLYEPNNETAGAFVPAQIIYDAFYRRYHSGTGAIIFLCIIWGAFFFCGLSTLTSAARVVSKLKICVSPSMTVDINNNACLFSTP
jgi:amino acid transporter